MIPSMKFTNNNLWKTAVTSLWSLQRSILYLIAAIIFGAITIPFIFILVKYAAVSNSVKGVILVCLVVVFLALNIMLFKKLWAFPKRLVFWSEASPKEISPLITSYMRSLLLLLLSYSIIIISSLVFAVQVHPGVSQFIGLGIATLGMIGANIMRMKTIRLMCKPTGLVDVNFERGAKSLLIANWTGVVCSIALIVSCTIYGYYIYAGDQLQQGNDVLGIKYDPDLHHWYNHRTLLEDSEIALPLLIGSLIVLAIGVVIKLIFSSRGWWLISKSEL